MRMFGVIAIWIFVLIAAGMFLNAGHYVMAFVLVLLILLATKVG